MYTQVLKSDGEIVRLWARDSQPASYGLQFEATDCIHTDMHNVINNIREVRRTAASPSFTSVHSQSRATARTHGRCARRGDS